MVCIQYLHFKKKSVYCREFIPVLQPMKHVNRIVCIIVLLLAIVVCGLLIRSLDQQVNALEVQVTTLQSQISSLQETMTTFQTTTTQEIDQLEVLVNDLGIQVAN